MSGEANHPGEAVEVLREIWAARGQSRAELDEAFGTARSCKNMRQVGFDKLAGPDGNLLDAWRATLRREGKLRDDAAGLRDLVTGSRPTDDRG